MLGSLATPSDESGASRLHCDDFPLEDESGLPLIPCPDCGLARVIERRSGNEKTKNYLRVFFKCPCNGFSKNRGFYKFQRNYLNKLKELGIVRIIPSPGMEIDDKPADGGDAMSKHSDCKVEGKKKATKEERLEAKMEDLLWKFNMLMLLFVVLVGAVLMYLAVGAK